MHGLSINRPPILEDESSVINSRFSGVKSKAHPGGSPKLTRTTAPHLRIQDISKMQARLKSNASVA
ncbi:hypothetical protein SERLADRAFT_387966 [Serpula lacrymans var. lacrymans S7.9]|uniref:Uncharacterized protein n=1 Tax=Serpula lacrymans var. lacrymans (strain S7.9) TaxID=578457 RepID=F8NTI0_SERL9|nr:uncharacterized protein SERLADRAFT_387966 [Serpula lacrymans var. lacrymans S7.9]EGO25652.1 hypothetical protein SERLADRAFT_387966 [Serpula lacrymans var. lacrymans S7.9]